MSNGGSNIGCLFYFPDALLHFWKDGLIIIPMMITTVTSTIPAICNEWCYFELAKRTYFTKTRCLKIFFR